MKQFLFLTVVIILFTGCATDLQEIKTDPKGFKDKEVTVSAQVNDVKQLGDYSILKLEAGERNVIFIGNPDKQPVVGEKSKLKGRVKTISIPLLPTQFYIIDPVLDDEISEGTAEAKKEMKKIFKELKRVIVEDIKPAVEEGIKELEK